MNLETKITIYKFTPQLSLLTQFQPVFFETESIRIPSCKADKYFITTAFVSPLAKTGA